jgi:hypothetical protein
MGPTYWSPVLEGDTAIVEVFVPCDRAFPQVSMATVQRRRQLIPKLRAMFAAVKLSARLPQLELVVQPPMIRARSRSRSERRFPIPERRTASCMCRAAPGRSRGTLAFS